MTFQTDHLSALAKRLPNFPLLETLLAEFKPDRVTGFATLGETAFLRHLRLIFVGAGDFSDTVLHGPSFHPMLLEVPDLAAELREVVREFLRQVQQLGDVPSLPAGSSRNSINRLRLPIAFLP